MGSQRSPLLSRNKPTLEVQHTGEYSHIFRKKTLWELLRLSAAVIGIEFTYSAVTSFVSPILLEMGIQYNTMSMVWAISPIIGFFLSPVMGSLSDRCSLSFGRRRVFMIIFAIFNVIGLLLVPVGETLSNETANNSVMHTVAVLITVVGVVIADYTSDALQSPSRAYLLDLCRPDDQARGLTIFTIMGGIGGFFGYLTGAFSWEDTSVYDGTFEDNAFSGHVHMFFTLAAFLFSICVIVSVTTFKEMPLKVVESIKATQRISIAIEGPRSGNYQPEQCSPALFHKSYGTSGRKPSFLETEEQHPTLKSYLLSIFEMPNSLKVLCVTNLLCWMAHSSYTLYFTDFVGTIVYGGDSSASVGTPERQLYEDGVKFGCVGMACFSISCTLYSMVIRSLIRCFSLKHVYMGGILIDAVSLLLMVLLKSKITVLLLSVGCGILYSTMFTIPYILLAHYHDIDVFATDENGSIVSHKKVRGLGTDISLFAACTFVAQFVLSLLASTTSNSGAVLLTGSVLAVCAFLSATKVMYLNF